MISPSHHDDRHWLRALHAEIVRLRESGVVIPPTLASLLAEVESASAKPPAAKPEMIELMQRDLAPDAASGARHHHHLARNNTFTHFESPLKMPRNKSCAA